MRRRVSAGNYWQAVVVCGLVVLAFGWGGAELLRRGTALMWFAPAHNISRVSRLGRPKNPRNVPQARDGGPLPSWQRVRSYRTRSQDVVAFAQTFAFVPLLKRSACFG